LREAYEEISRQRRTEIERHGHEPDASEDAREAAARRIACGAYRAYLRHDPQSGDAVDLGDEATLIIGRTDAASTRSAIRWPWGLIGGLVSLGLLQALATVMARRSEQSARDSNIGVEPPR
jgi:hypothetical protein